MVPDPNTQESTWLTGADGTIDLREKVIAISMPCVECEYDLRGAPAAGQCAECGASIAEALAHAIDPVAHRLPSLADPRAVGDGLVAAVGAMTASVVLPFVGFLISPLIELGWQSVPTNPTVSPLVKLAVLGAAALVLSLGCVACWALRPRKGGPLQHDARRAVAFLGVALAVLTAGQVLLCAALSDMDLLIAGVECILAGLLLSMLALRRVLVEAGRRSRLFRTATLSKQRIGPVLTANVVSMVLFAGFWMTRESDLADAGFVLGVLWLVITGMLIVGLLYLLVNAWWIRAALHRPPPRLSELVEDRPSATSAA